MRVSASCGLQIGLRTDAIVWKFFNLAFQMFIAVAIQQIRVFGNFAGLPLNESSDWNVPTFLLLK
jgi:hypothetical protein